MTQAEGMSLLGVAVVVMGVVEQMIVTDGSMKEIETFRLPGKRIYLHTEIRVEVEAAPQMTETAKRRGGRDGNATSVTDRPRKTPQGQEEVICPTRMSVRHCQCSEHPQQNELGSSTL